MDFALAGPQLHLATIDAPRVGNGDRRRVVRRVKFLRRMKNAGWIEHVQAIFAHFPPTR